MPRPHYDGKASTWRDVYISRDPYARRIQRRRDAIVAAFQKQLKGRRAMILDAGCGTGEIAGRLSALGHLVVGLDLSTEMLLEAQQLVREGKPLPLLVRGSLLNLPFRSGQFDATVSAGVMEHIMPRRVGERFVDPEVLAIRELARILKPNGFMVITGSNLFRVHWLLDPRQLLRALRHRRQGRYRMEDGPKLPVNHPADALSATDVSWSRRRTAREMRRFLDSQNLGILDWTGIGFGPFTFFGLHVVSFERSVKISEKLERMIQRPAWRFLILLAATWVLTLAP